MTYPTLPEFIRPDALKVTMASNVKANRSPWTNTVQTVGYGGTRWIAELSLSMLTDWESRQIEAAVFGLDGMAGRIWIGDSGREGTIPKGAPVVFGAGQNPGITLQTSGWTPGQKVMAKGSYLQVGDELKMVTDDAWSDVNGRALLHITPRLRRSPQNGAPVEVQAPKGLFMLAQNDNGVSRAAAFNNSMSLKFEEAIS